MTNLYTVDLNYISQLYVSVIILNILSIVNEVAYSIYKGTFYLSPIDYSYNYFTLFFIIILKYLIFYNNIKYQIHIHYFYQMRLVTKQLFSFSKIGFIGLGNMGFSMAANLASKGHQVWGNDIDTTKAQ